MLNPVGNGQKAAQNGGFLGFIGGVVGGVVNGVANVALGAGAKAAEWAALAPEETQANDKLLHVNNVLGQEAELKIVLLQLADKVATSDLVRETLAGIPVVGALLSKINLQPFLRTLLPSIFANLLAQADRENALNKNRDNNLVAILSYFMAKVDAELAKVTDDRSLDAAADRILAILFPGGENDLPLNDGNVNWLIGTKRLLWDGIKGGMKSFLEAKWNTDKAQAAYMQEVTPADKEAAQKVTRDIVDLVMDQGPETYADQVVSMLQNTGNQSSHVDKQLSKGLADQLKPLFTEETPEGKVFGPQAVKFRIGVVALLTPVVRHIQSNKADPKGYTLAHFVDNLLGAATDVHNKTSDETLGAKLKVVLNVEGMPLSSDITGAMREFLDSKVDAVFAQIERPGKDDVTVRAEFSAKLTQLVGAEAAVKYQAACSVCAEKIAVGVMGFLVRDEKAQPSAEFIAESHVKKLAESILLQVLVNSLENARSGKNPASFASVLEKVGSEIQNLLSEHSSEIGRILASNGYATKEQRREHLAAKFVEISEALLNLVSPKSQRDLRISMPFAGAIESQWEKIGREILPGQIAKALVDSAMFCREKAANKAALDSVERFKYQLDAEGKYVPPQVLNEADCEFKQPVRVATRNDEKFSAVFGGLAADMVKELPGFVNELVKDDANIGLILDALVDQVAESKLPEAAVLKEFLQDAAMRNEFKSQLAAFLQRNPGMMKVAAPILAEYVESFLLHVAKPLINKVNGMEQVKVGSQGQRVVGNKRFINNVALQLVEDISDHFEALEDVRVLKARWWWPFTRTHHVSHGEFVSYFRKGVPVTKAMENAQVVIEAAKKEIRILRKQIDDPANVVPRADIEQKLTTYYDAIKENKAIIRTEQEKYLAALKSGKAAAYQQKLKEEGQLPPEPTYMKLMSGCMAEGGDDASAKKVLDARNAAKKEIANAEKIIRDQRQLLKKAKTPEQQDQCFAKIDEAKEKIAELKKDIVAERTKNLQPLVANILKLVEMGKADQIPLPESVRKKVIELAATKGAEAVGNYISDLFSRDSVNEKLLNLFEGLNEDYYKTNDEKEAERKMGPAKLAEHLQAEKAAHAKRGFASRFVRHVARTHNAYFGSTGKSFEPNPADPDFIAACDRVIHKIKQLVPSSLLNFFMSSSFVRGSVAESLAETVQRSLDAEVSVSEIVDDVFAAGVEGTKSALKTKFEDPSVTRQRRVEAELKALEREKRMLAAGTEFFTHTYMGLFLDNVAKIINAPGNFASKAPGAMLFKRFLKLIFVTALFDALTYLATWAVFPVVKLFEVLILRTWVSYRSTNVAEFLYLDINENLADKALEAVVNELELTLQEIAAEAK